MIGLGIVLMVVGLILWLTVAPGIGVILLIAGAICAVAGALLGAYGRSVG